MKLRLVLKTTTKKDKDVYIKFNIAPSKHYGFINFINLALNQGKPVSISFEKIGKKGDKEESKIVGTFKFEGKSDAELKQFEEEIKDQERKRKKQHQKRIQG
ncbi:MAG: hypothetical protein KGD68_08550 [Candidatus Lokiarchaeota archaeon]|nr:hypothetical protein [Candidatus Lokiarchaeota archaeon]